MNDYTRELLSAYRHYYKQLPGHIYKLLVVKNTFNSEYNFFIEDLHGSIYSYGLVSIPFEKVELYKEALRALLKETNLAIEYRGFEVTK